MADPIRAVLAVLVATVALVGCTSWSDESATWRLTDDPDEPTLQVQAVFGGSSCTRFKEWNVDETEEAVTIEAVIERSSSPECTADQVHEDATIRLDVPLGDRQLRGCEPERPDANCRGVVPQP